MFVVICMQEAEYKDRRLPSHQFVLHTSMEKVPSSLSPRSRLKAQSAMEYLMTYGWAILIIAIVLGVLYYLGVFNATNLAPHAQPGSCQVYRPDGPGSLQFLSLQGTCGLLPTYVGVFGSGSDIYGSMPMLQTATGTYDTVSFWMYWTGSGGEVVYGEGGSTEDGYTLYFPSYANCFGFNTNHGDLYGVNALPLANKWVFVTAVMYNGGSYVGNSQIYINGVSQALTQCYGTAETGLSYTPYNISYPGYYFNGKLSNLQVYNASLSANDIKALYNEGIGGAPIDLENLIAWMPLNGNSDDYSGNLNSGTATSVAYTSSWTSGYSAP